MEFHDFHVPQNKQKKIAFEGMQDAYSVDLELKYSTQEGAKSFCFPVVHHEEFKQHFSERFLRNEKAVSWTLIHETATVFLLTDEMNLY
jgi:hypothetical protein